MGRDLFTKWNTPSPSATSSRHPSEDWVRQTGGLSIDSPMSTAGTPVSEQPTPDMQDDIMVRANWVDLKNLTNISHASLQ